MMPTSPRGTIPTPTMAASRRPSPAVSPAPTRTGGTRRLAPRTAPGPRWARRVRISGIAAGQWVLELIPVRGRSVAAARRLGDGHDARCMPRPMAAGADRRDSPASMLSRLRASGTGRRTRVRCRIRCALRGPTAPGAAGEPSRPAGDRDAGRASRRPPAPRAHPRGPLSCRRRRSPRSAPRGAAASLPGSRPVAYLDAASLVIAVFGAALVITCARYARLFAVVLPSGERGDPRGERPRLVAMDGGGAGPPRGASRRAPGREPGS